MTLAEWLAEDYDLDEWFPGAETVAPGAPAHTFVAHKLRERSAAATALADLLARYGWSTVEAALLDALRGLAEPQVEDASVPARADAGDG